MKFLNKDRKPVDLFTYACVLARCYALAIAGPAKVSLLDGRPNPYYDHLKEEQKTINKWLDEHYCLEDEVVDKVRVAIPETDWDSDLRKVTKEVDEALFTKASEEVLQVLLGKLKLFNNSDWKERVAMEKLLDG